MRLGPVIFALSATLILSIVLAFVVPFEVEDYQVEAFKMGAYVMAGFASVCFIFGECTNNFS